MDRAGRLRSDRLGLIAALELLAGRATRAPFEPPGRVGSFFFERGHANALIIRNIQDSIAMCPPLVISPEQIDELLDKLATTLDETHDHARREHGAT